MKLLVVGLNYAPEFIANAVYTTGLTNYMVTEGVDTTVISAVPYYPAWRRLDGWSAWRWVSRTTEQGCHVTHCPIYIPQTPTGMRRILHYVSFALTSLPVLFWKALTQRPDVVLVVAPSLLFAPTSLLAARLAGAKTWTHIQDFEVEAAFATGLLQEESRVGKCAKAFEKWVLRRFDLVTSISDPMLEKLRAKGVEENRIAEFRNWANLAKVTPIEGTVPLKAELGIDTPYVALYSGNLANKQGLEILPEMARHLSHRDDLTIAICGDGPMRAPLEEMARDCPQIRFFPLQPLDRLSELLGMADVHLLPQIAGAAELVLPSKLTNMLASGRPVIATTASDTALAHEIDGAGVIVPPGDAKALASALENLIEVPQERVTLGKAARQRALDRWDMNAILSRMKARLDTLID